MPINKSIYNSFLWFYRQLFRIWQSICFLFGKESPSISIDSLTLNMLWGFLVGTVNAGRFAFPNHIFKFFVR